MTARTSTVRSFGAGEFVGEPAVVAKRDARGEDDVFVMTFCYDRATDTSSLVIIDGADFAGPPLAVVQLPVRVPNGYHGSWIAAGA